MVGAAEEASPPPSNNQKQDSLSKMEVIKERAEAKTTIKLRRSLKQRWFCLEIVA